ncbi:hypothetical protein J3B02_003227 [Coemansia erecta]|nr:hypothetical protein J3B02_003227 [Coemansia erecta]KAJ2879032.1 hypothetical protein FB639_003196 [Coemansia asiatica]
MIAPTNQEQSSCSSSDVIDLSKVSTFTNAKANTESSEQYEVRQQELKKKKAEKETKRLELLYEINDRQWRNSDVSNARLREIMRSERKGKKSSISGKRMLLAKIASKDTKHSSVFDTSSATIGSFSKDLGKDLGIKQNKKSRLQEDCEETSLAALAATYGSGTDEEQTFDTQT